MSDTKQNIPVNMVAYEPYENWPTHISLLGYVTHNTIENLMNVFASATPDKNACILSMGLQYTDRVRFGRTYDAGARTPQLDLDGMFYPDRYPKCCAQKKNQTDAQKIKRYAKNLRNGKCCDEFIQKTLGMILFPEHYAKQK